MRILIITQVVLGNTLGAVKVGYDLKSEYERQGHVVDTLDGRDIYPKGRNFFLKHFGKHYSYRFWQYLKINAHRYDVIDANSECVIFPKESFGFKGILMVRSHGILPVYKKFEETPRYKNALENINSNSSLKTKLGNIYRGLQYKKILKKYHSSVKHADIVHALNSIEYQYFLEYGIPDERILLLPNGLPTQTISDFNKVSNSNRKNTLSFLGSWTLRKGIKDLNEIIESIGHAITLHDVYILGSFASPERVKAEFKRKSLSLLRIIPSFKPEDLLRYLQECKVGIFPSYVEGFPLAVIEQLACGIPVVAYNVPGVADILGELDQSLLIKPGNVEHFSMKVVEILELDQRSYDLLADKCKSVSKKYLVNNVAKKFLDEFQRRLSTEQAG